MLFSRYNLLKNHGEFVHLNMLKWALKFVPELGKKTVSDDETVKSMDIGKGGIDIDTVNDETHIESVKHIPFSNVQVNGESQDSIDFRTDLKDDVRTVTYDKGKVGHFDQYTKVSKSTDPDKLIPAVRLDDSQKVKVDGVEEKYIDGIQSLSKDDEGNLTPEGVTKLKPYTSVLRDDDSTASKVKIEHDTKNKLTALSLPTTGEKYTIPLTNVQINGKPQENIQFKADSKDNVRSVTFDDGTVEHFDQYTKVSASSDPDKVIPAVRLDDSQKVKVDGTEETYVDGFQSLSKDDDGNLTPGKTTKLKPYTSVLRDDDSTASKVKIEHDSNNLLTALSLPATGEKYTIPAGAPASKSGTSVVDADNPTQIADKASLKGDAYGNLTSVALSTGKNYNVKTGTTVADAGAPNTVADNMRLKGDSNGVLTNISLSTGKNYTIPAPKPQKPSTVVVDADNDSQVADKASLKGDSSGNLTTIALSTGKTFKIPPQQAIPGTAVVKQSYVDGTTVSDSDAADNTYKRLGFHYKNVRTYDNPFGEDFIDGVNLFPSGFDSKKVDFEQIGPYTAVLNDFGNLYKRVQIKKTDDSNNIGEGGDVFLKEIIFPEEDGRPEQYTTLKLPRPFRLTHVFQKGQDSQIGDFEVYQDFDKLTIDLGDTLGTNISPGEPSAAKGGQEIKAIHLHRYSHKPGDINTSFTIDVSSLNLVIKEDLS